jgi:hypothetical protein
LAYHLQIDANPVPVPDPAYHFDVLLLMWMRIEVQSSKMMGFHADPQHEKNIERQTALSTETPYLNFFLRPP